RLPVDVIDDRRREQNHADPPPKRRYPASPSHSSPTHRRLCHEIVFTRAPATHPLPFEKTLTITGPVPCSPIPTTTKRNLSKLLETALRQRRMILHASTKNALRCYLGYCLRLIPRHFAMLRPPVL